MKSPFARNASFVLLTALAIGLTGCAGGGDSDPNPFAGPHDGTYDSSAGDNGSVHVEISEGGTFDGTISSYVTAGATGTINGRINRAGHFRGVVAADGTAEGFNYEGDLARQSDGTIRGTLTQDGGGSTVAIVLDITTA